MQAEEILRNKDRCLGEGVAGMGEMRVGEGGERSKAEGGGREERGRERK